MAIKGAYKCTNFVYGLPDNRIAMTPEKLLRQIDFIKEIDKLKYIPYLLVFFTCKSKVLVYPKISPVVICMAR